MEWVTIDGSYGEGGGQILRSSLALSALTGKPLRIVHIRAKRKNPGLRPQHLTAVQAAAAVCQAQVEGAHIGSTELRFIPTALRAGEFRVDVSADQPSAGSGTLVFQTVFPALLFAPAPSTIRIVRCGTHVPMSPPADYLARVFLPTVARMGVEASLQLLKAGWFPAGGGELLARIQPMTAPLTPITWTERGALRRLWVFSALSNLPRSIAVRQANQAVNRLLAMGFQQSDMEVDIGELPSPSVGTVVLLIVETETGVAGFSALGERGKPAERVADEAVDAFAAHWRTDAPVDPHLADQLVLLMALAKGESVIRTSALTSHTATQIWLVEQFLPVRFEVAGKVGEVATLRVQGVGWTRQN